MSDSEEADNAPVVGIMREMAASVLDGTSKPGRRGLFAAAGTVAVAAGYGAVKALAWGDRRRHGVHGDVVAAARLDLAEPPNTRHRTLRLRDGTSLHVLERGSTSGKPIVLLHGVTLAASVWHHQLRELGDEFRVVAMDLRGHGRSTVGSEGYGLQVLARDLVEVLEQLELRDVLLAGHSMGGMTIMRALVDHGAFLHSVSSGIALISTAGSRVASGPVTAPLRVTDAVVHRAPELAGRVARSVPGDLGYGIVRLGFGKSPSPLWVEQARDLLNDMSPISLAESVLALLEHDVLDGLRTVRLPTRVLVGTRDLVTPLRQSKDLVDAIPGAVLETFEDAGHLLALERRAELSASLRRFRNEL